ncbi:Transporter of the ATP-binding cassette (ABC) [Thecaphora frezii]
MSNFGCSGTFWDGADWDECFQTRVLNTAIPIAAVSASLATLAVHSIRQRRGLVSSAKQVAQLDPASSSFAIPEVQDAGPSSHAASRNKRSRRHRNIFARVIGSLLPWNSSRILNSKDDRRVGVEEDQAAANAAMEVFRTENAVILNEVHQTPLQNMDPSRLQRMQRLALTRRLIEAIVSVALAAVHAAAWALGWQSFAWQACWTGIWIYLVLLSAYTLSTGHSLFMHKATVMLAYFVITLFNLRTSLIRWSMDRSYLHKEAVVVTSVQLGLAAVALVPTLFFPLQSTLPRELRAIYATISPAKVHGEPGTAIPSPILYPADRSGAPSAQRGDGVRVPAPPSAASKEKLLSPPEDTASLYSRIFFGFVTPSLLKHFKVQFTLPAVPDLPVADKAAAVVAGFRAFSTSRKTGGESGAGASTSRAKDKAAPEQLRPSNRPLWFRLLSHFSGLLLVQIFFATLEATLVLAPPFFLNKILTYIAERGERKQGTLDGARPFHLAVLYAFGMLFGQIGASLCSSRALFTGRRICIRLRAILITEIVTKTLRRKDSGGTKTNKEEGAADQGENPDDAKKEDNEEGKDKRASDGQIVNLISVDVFKVSEICAYLHFLVPKAPVTIALCLYYLIRLLGWSAVIGFMVLLASMPAQALVSTWFVKLQRRLLEMTDKRLNLATEVLGCIKTVKFFAWEDSFNARMDETRQQELRTLAIRYLAWLCNTLTYTGAPMMVTCATFGAHTKLFHQPLTAETAFTALALFNTLRNPLDALPDMIVQILNSLVSVRRIDAYLREEETQKYQQLLVSEEERMPEDPVVGFQDATFTYSDEEDALDNGAFCLRDLNLSFPVGKFSVIAGPVGSGKTSLLLAFLGETRQLSGKTFMPCPVARALAPVDPETGLSDSVAYCSQSPWLLGTTLKENILFGAAYDEKRYRAVIKACALEPDLKILEYGDETEVGEKGTSLSGGQKARIALARAFYSSAKHILIDDALSAVDSHTAKHLYRHALKGALAKGRTILLVTHAISLCLPGAAFVVAMNDGRVVAAGAPDVVNATGVFSDEGAALQESLKKNGHSDGDADEELTIEQLAAGGTDEAEREEMQKKLDKKAAHANEETFASGAVGKKSYSLYLGSVAKSFKVALLMWGSMLLCFAAGRMLDISSGAWLMRWARSHEYSQETTSAILSATGASIGRVSVPPIVETLWSSAGGSIRNFHLTSYLSLPVPQRHEPQQSPVNLSVAPPLRKRSVAFASPKQLVLDAAAQQDSTPFPVADPMLTAEAPHNDKSSRDLDTYYLLVYLAISLTYVFMCGLRDAYEFWLSLRASRKIYRRLTSAILNAKPQFFDRTPIGRIMNRLSKDVETVDQEMAVCLLFLVDCTLTCAAILMLICWATPAFILAAIVIIGVYYIIGALYLVSSRDLKRIESVERSPIYTVVGEVLSGCVTIRAYGDAGRFTRHTLRLVDKANRAFFFLWYTNRWLSIRVDVAGAFVAFLAAIFLLLNVDMEASLAGFILSYAITFVDSVLWIVRMYTQTEINMNSVERVSEYLELEPEEQGGVEPPAYWPSSEGSIVVDNLSVRYTPEFPRVLSGVNLEIKPREKVGIVGRTGSGKSTLALCFFRFLEAEEGAIFIDGIDISKVPMKTLRQRLTVIPQDAQLFSGTVRSNLDPFNVYDDADLWQALERCRLASSGATSRAVSRPATRPPSPAGGEPAESEDAEAAADIEMVGRTNVITSLDAPVEQGGRNFSAGQKQLLALARGLLKLRDSRILLLDESTANLDSASDAQIQKTIRQEMAPQATIITIAHRIKTIADYDKICVLDKGKVIEFGSPKELMEKEGGVFQSMCEQSGEMAELKRLADEADAERRAQA